jgi:hypothetical protein
MRGVWGILSKASAITLVFGGTVHAIGGFRAHDSFFTLVVDSGLDSRVDAYVGLVRDSKKELKGHEHDVVKLRELSERWITQSKQGKITQIYPGYYGESLLDGPKGQIFNTCTSISNKLTECADQEAKEGNPVACLDAVRAIELINVIRYGSYETMFTSMAYLRRPFRLLKANKAMFTPEVTVRLEKAQDVKSRENKTELLTQLVNRQRSQYTVRYGKVMAHEDDSSYVSFLRRKNNQIAAEHFYGFDRDVEISDTKKHK